MTMHKKMDVSAEDVYDSVLLHLDIYIFFSSFRRQAISEKHAPIHLKVAMNAV